MSLKITLELDSWGREAAASRLFDLGAAGLEEGEDGPIGWFNDDTDLDGLRAGLERFLDALEPDPQGRPVTWRLRAERIVDEDWNTAWKAAWQQQDFGRRLSICPSWLEPGGGGERVVLRIDPGSAFGTGSHESTRLLLEWLDGYEDLEGCTVLDAGCGTGVLAIAALKLGAGFVMGIDIEAEAVQVSRENADLNDCRLRSWFRQALPRDLGPDYAFDLVLANIQRTVIEAFFDDLLLALRPGGELLVSGILAAEEPQLLALASERGLATPEVRRLGEWIALGYRRPDEGRP
jgi:ribosomal protein L11 methyltransferase